MKRISLFSLISAAVICSSSVFASATALQQYGSTMHPMVGKASLLHPPTDITVVNASSSYFYAVVPNSPINDYLTPGFNDHIYNHDASVWYTNLVLQDVYRGTFFNFNVCRLAIVTITGYTGNFRYNIDNDLCN